MTQYCCSKIWIVCSLLTSLLFGACGSNTSEQTKLVITGSSTVAPLTSEIAKRYESLNPDVRIDVQTGGSSRGIADAKRGTADIGMVSRVLKPEESDLTAHTIAMDGITIILHESNPVSALTNDQVVSIYTGNINNWSQLGGNDAEITVVNKASGRSTLELFLNFFQLSETDVKPTIIIGDNQQGIHTVAGDPNAIGYVSIGTAEYEESNGSPIKLLPMDGVSPSVMNVRNQSFPLTRPLNLVTKGPTSQTVQSFIEFAQSSAVNDLVEAQYFVPITE